MAWPAEAEQGDELVRQELLASQSAAGNVLEENLDSPLYLVDLYLTRPPLQEATGESLWPAATETLLQSLQSNERLRAALVVDSETLIQLTVKAPDVIERLKTAIASERLELVVGDWPLMSGEPLLRRIARQVATAQATLEVDVQSCLLSSEQFFPQLPQVLAGFGIRQLIVIAGDVSLERPTTVRLQGPDGSAVATALAASGASGKARHGDPLFWSNERLEDLREQAGTGAALVCRFSDAASPDGPVAARAAVAARDDIRFVTPREYFQRAGTSQASAHVEGAVTQGEWGRPSRGTSDAERSLLLAERFDALAYAMGKDSDEGALQRAWQDILRLQYLESTPERGQAVAATGRVLAQNALNYLASQIDTSQVEETGYVVFNPSSWPRNEYVEVEATGENQSVWQGKRELPSQVLSQTEEKTTIGFIVEVPPLGYRLLDLRPSPSRSPSPLMSEIGHGFRNDFYSATIEEHGGLSLQVTGRRLADGAGCLMVWKDGRLQDSREGMTAVGIDRQGPVLERYAIEGRLGGMPFRQWATLFHTLARIDLHTEIDFGRGVSFGGRQNEMPPDEEAAAISLYMQATPGKRLLADSPFYVGNAPAHRALALGLAGLDDDSGETGLAVLSGDASSYSLDSVHGMLRIILAKASQGVRLSGTGIWEHALLPFESRAEALKASLDYQLPCPGVYVTPHPGSLPAEGSFLRADPAGVVLSAMFVRGGNVYVRLWNASDKNVTARIVSGAPLSLCRCSLSLVDETATGDTVDISPWAVQTLRLSGAGES
jgi:hypothetical protein